MKDLILQIEFWVAMALAVAIKLRASPNLSPATSVLTVLIAIGSALVLTQPIMAHFNLNGETHTAAVAALTAVSTEHLARQVLTVSLVDLLKAWRGK